MWDRVVSFGSEQSHVGNSNLIWERVQGVQDRMECLESFKIFLYDFQVSWIVRKPKITVLKVDKVQDNFAEV